MPGVVAAAGNVGFVQQGTPIPVRQLDTSHGAKLEPRAIKAIFTLSRETIDGSNAESLTRLLMVESVGAALDAILFDANAGDTVRPAGLG